VTYDACFATTIDGEWRATPVVFIGPPTSDAHANVLVTSAGMPLLVVALNVDSGPFRDAVVWHDNVVIGYGDAVHVVSLSTREIVSHALDSYFGHLYVIDDALLVTDARRVLRLADHGAVMWKSTWVGIDGVTIDAIEDGIISGDGEWDPPGGWQPFRLSLETGETVSDPDA
jgi:hypothetical protein